MNSKTKITGGADCSRRRFLKTAASAGAATLLGGGFLPRGAKGGMADKPPRTRISNPFISQQGKPILVSVEGDHFATMLDAGMQALGGWDRLFTNNQDILIKPNCNSIDTYPLVSSGHSVRALIEAMEPFTNSGISVGDMGYHSTSQVYAKSRIEAEVDETDADLLTFSVSDTYSVRHPNWAAGKANYLVFEEVYDASVIVNLPCLKRHYLGKMTCGIKNNVGTIPGENASSVRSSFHTYSGDAFLEEIAEIACLINPDLTIVDARGVLAGNGPLLTMPGAYRINDVDRVVLSGDIVAADLYCSDLLESRDPGFSASLIAPTVARAHERGMGVSSLNDVEVIEISTTDVEKEDVGTPETFVLSQNYPNPFNPSTKIRYAVAERAHVRLNVFDVAGRRVATLVDGVKSRGDHRVTFDAGNLPSGRYVYRLKAGEKTLSKTMMLAR